jgi:hypothetical protein
VNYRTMGQAAVAALALLLSSQLPAAAAGPSPTCFMMADGYNGVLAVYGHDEDLVLCDQNRQKPGVRPQTGPLPYGLSLVCTFDYGQIQVFDNPGFADDWAFMVCSDATFKQHGDNVVVWNRADVPNAPQPTCYVTVEGITGVLAIGPGTVGALCASNDEHPDLHFNTGPLPSRLVPICTLAYGQMEILDDGGSPDGSGAELCSGFASKSPADDIVIWNTPPPSWQPQSGAGGTGDYGALVRQQGGTKALISIGSQIPQMTPIFKP